MLAACLLHPSLSNTLTSLGKAAEFMQRKRRDSTHLSFLLAMFGGAQSRHNGQQARHSWWRLSAGEKGRRTLPGGCRFRSPGLPASCRVKMTEQWGKCRPFSVSYHKSLTHLVAPHDTRTATPKPPWQAGQIPQCTVRSYLHPSPPTFAGWRADILKDYIGNPSQPQTVLLTIHR